MPRPTDLSFFYESDINEKYWSGFSNSLPTHLQDMFFASFGGLSALDRLSVLQGYRGPHENGSSGDSEHLGAINGLQEVRYWWGGSKHVNWIPIIGFAHFAAWRVHGNTDWHSLYFDSKTGECLSHNIEQAASKLNDVGNQLFNSGEFIEAKEYFSNAYTHSHNNDYKDNENKAQAATLNTEGDALYNQNEYAAAIAKYQAAQSQCPSSETDALNIYKNNEASSLNKQGLELWNNKDYAGAAGKFSAAYQKCSSGYSGEQTFKDNMNHAKAETLNTEGDALYNQNEYAAAIAKYQAAQSQCPSSKTDALNKYKSNLDKVKKEVDSIGLKELGENEFNAGRYESARDKYLEACDKSLVASNKTTYTNCVNKAQVELDASELNTSGEQLFERGDYEAALDKYLAAHHKSQITKEKSIYAFNRDKAQTEIDAINMNSQGDNLFQQGKYGEAGRKYQEAYNKSKLSYQRSHYKSNIDKTEYKSVFTDFNLMLNEDVTDSELKEFTVKLEKMIDEGYASDSEIVNRFHVLSLRIARRTMSSQLESMSREDKSVFIKAILSLIYTEIKVLVELKIPDPKLEQELKSFRVKLSVLGNEYEQSNINDDVRVDITSIAIRVLEINEEVENIVLERLGQNTQLEHGGN